MIAEMVFLSYINISPIIGFVIYIYTYLRLMILIRIFPCKLLITSKEQCHQWRSNLFRQEGVRENDCSAFKEEK